MLSAAAVVMFYVCLYNILLLRLGPGIELQYFYGTDCSASILSSIEKCQISKFSIE